MVILMLYTENIVSRYCKIPYFNTKYMFDEIKAFIF